MKTLELLKDEYAILFCQYPSWEELLNDIPHHDIENHTDEVAKLFAKEVAKETLKNASENVKLTLSEFSKRKDGSTGWNEVTLKDNLYIINDGCNIVANKQSVLNETNIPSL